MNRTILLIAMTALALFAGCNNKQHADLIVHNAVVYTVDESFSQAEALLMPKAHQFTLALWMATVISRAWAKP